MIEAQRLDTGPCRLFLKLENQNPGGSIKDRIALSMIEAAERAKQIQKGSLLVEATERWPDVLVGSYPHFTDDGPEVEVVLKSADPELLAEAAAWLEAALDRLR